MKNVKILSTPGCPGCATVKEMLEKLKKEIPMKIEVIDVTEDPKILEKYPILSAPGIVIDGKRRNQKRQKIFHL